MRLLRPMLRGLVAALLAAAPVHAAPPETDAAPAAEAYERAMGEAEALLARSDNAGAEQALRRALQQAPAGSARADTLQLLAIALAHQERFAEAEPLIAEAETIVRALPGGGTAELLAEILRAKTLVLYRTGRVEEARAAYREAKKLLEQATNTWSTAEDGRVWIHNVSGWRFPDTHGPFLRLRRTMLDETGYNVAVHYRIGPRGWARTLASIYISVDRGVPLPVEFDASRNEIVLQYPDATVLADEPSEVAGFAGFRYALDLPPTADGRIRRTALSAFEHGRVTIRIRVSYPKAEAAAREPTISDFIGRVLRDAPKAP